MLAAATSGGEGQHGHTRLFTQQLLGAATTGTGDVHQLLGRGVDDQAAVGVDEAALHGMMRLVQRHQEEAGHQAGTRCRADELDGGTNHVGRGVHGAGHRAVHLALGHQHVGKHQGLADLGSRLLGRHALVLAMLEETIGQGLRLGIVGGITDGEAIQRQPFGGRTLFDGLAVAHQRDAGHAALLCLHAGPQHAGIIGFTQHDVPVQRAGTLLDALQQVREGGIGDVGESAHGKRRKRDNGAGS